MPSLPILTFPDFFLSLVPLMEIHTAIFLNNYGCAEMNG